MYVCILILVCSYIVFSKHITAYKISVSTKKIDEFNSQAYFFQFSTYFFETNIFVTLNGGIRYFKHSVSRTDFDFP